MVCLVFCFCFCLILYCYYCLLTYLFSAKTRFLIAFIHLASMALLKSCAKADFPPHMQSSTRFDTRLLEIGVSTRFLICADSIDLMP